jgi:hypothetical protein
MPLDGFNLPYADLIAKHGFVPANHRDAQHDHVELRRIFDENGVEIDGYRSVWNDTKRKTLAVHSDGYKLIPNEVFTSAIEDALAASGLDLTGMHVGIDTAYDGRRLFQQYLLPAHTVRIDGRQGGIDVALRIVAFNSYDGSTGLRVRAGGYTFVCANTSVSGQDAAMFSMRHTSGADVNEAAKRLVDAAEAFVRESEGWKVWPEIPVTDQQALGIFKAMGASESIVEHLSKRWMETRDLDPIQGGANAWALYSTLTAWATHEESRSKSNAAAARYDREGKVQKALATKEWQRLVAA